MGNRSKDDRSNSLNPNNAAYWASVANRRNQTGGADYADDWIATGPLGPTPHEPVRTAVTVPEELVISVPAHVMKDPEPDHAYEELVNRISSLPF